MNGTGRWWLLVLVAASVGCGREPPRMLGSLEWERVTLRAPAAERIDRIAVAEGEAVEVGQLIATLDDRVPAAQLAAAEAEVRRLDARFDELLAGPRGERIRSAQAREARAASLADNARQERRRVDALVARGLLSAAEQDRARTADEAAGAELAALRAELAELVAGSRSEEIAQAVAAVAAARANATVAAVRHQRLRIVAPRAGVIDSLPFEPGDEPPAGAAIATLRVGDAPYARIYVPESRRLQVSPGTPLELRLHGSERVLAGRVRTIATEPSFTPYFALAGDDVDRLVFVAEVALDPAEAAMLPAGLAVSAAVPEGVDD